MYIQYHYIKRNGRVQEVAERKHAGVSGYERALLILTALFLLICGLWFYHSRPGESPTVTVTVLTPPRVSPTAEGEAAPHPESLLPGERINLNTDGAGDLERLPGIGPKLAQAIVEDREKYGPFRKVDDLLRVSGIGEKTLEGLRDYARVK